MISERLSGNRGIAAEAYAFEKLTVGSATATGNGGIFVFSTGSYMADGRSVVRALVTVSAADIRYLYDGTVPTTAQGHFMRSGDTFIIEGYGNVTGFKTVRDSNTAGATQPVLNITYEGFRT